MKCLSFKKLQTDSSDSGSYLRYVMNAQINRSTAVTLWFILARLHHIISADSCSKSHTPPYPSGFVGFRSDDWAWCIMVLKVPIIRWVNCSHKGMCCSWSKTCCGIERAHCVPRTDSLYHYSPTTPSTPSMNCKHDAGWISRLTLLIQNSYHSDVRAEIQVHQTWWCLYTGLMKPEKRPGHYRHNAYEYIFITAVKCVVVICIYSQRFVFITEWHITLYILCH